MFPQHRMDGAEITSAPSWVESPPNVGLHARWRDHYRLTMRDTRWGLPFGRHLKRRGVACLAASMLVAASLSSCGTAAGEGQPEDAASMVLPADSPPPIPSPAALEAFFRNYVSSDPASVAKALELTSPGSPAYVRTHMVLLSATAASNSSYVPTETRTVTVEAVDGGFKTCTEYDGSAPYCSVWSDVKFEGGQIASFAVDSEYQLENVTIGTREARNVGDVAEVTFLYASNNRSEAGDVGSMSVILDVHSTTSPPYGVMLGESTYHPPEGAEQSNNGAGPGVLAAGEQSPYTFAFGYLVPGGTLTLRLARVEVGVDTDFEDGLETFEIEIPIRAEGE